MADDSERNLMPNKFLINNLGSDLMQLRESDRQELFIEALIAQWRFFPPSSSVVKDILRLNEKLGDAYFDGEYERLAVQEGDAPEYGEEAVTDKNWFKRLFSQISEMVFHEEEEGGRRSKVSEDETISFFQKFIAERVYNHLAMLARSPHARKGGAFSIREELTEEIAGKLGLGLYLHEKTDLRLRAETYAVLLKLAGEFQRWLTVVAQGSCETTWGVIHTPDRLRVNLNPASLTLILTPDVKEAQENQKGASLAARQEAATVSAK